MREKADLTVQQKIGLQYYDEFQKRIPRLEVEQVETLIKAEIQKIDSNLSITICGSYRRGKKDCGDIDVLVTGSEYFDITKLIKALHLCKFLTDVSFPFNFLMIRIFPFLLVPIHIWVST